MPLHDRSNNFHPKCLIRLLTPSRTCWNGCQFQDPDFEKSCTTPDGRKRRLQVSGISDFRISENPEFWNSDSRIPGFPENLISEYFRVVFFCSAGGLRTTARQCWLTATSNIRISGFLDFRTSGILEFRFPNIRISGFPKTNFRKCLSRVFFRRC